MLKKLRWPLFVLSLWLPLSACAPKPPDVPACENLGPRFYTEAGTGHLMLEPSPTCMEKVSEPECGHCVTIMSGQEFFVGEKAPHLFNGKPWSTLKAQSVMLPAAESYAPLAAYIINACKKMNCSDDVNRFKIRLGRLSLPIF